MNEASVQKSADNDHLIDLIAEHSDGRSQYLSFQLSNELYCVDILSVDEIRGFQLPTILPNSPHYVKGVINIRGDIVPVVDLRAQFNLNVSDYNDQTVVLVLHTESEQGSRSMGFIVDKVSDVFSIDPDDINDSANFAGDIEAGFVTGLANVNEHVVVVLDVNELLGIDAIQQHYAEGRE